MVTNDPGWLTCKEKGNEEFKQNNFDEAITHYTKSLKLCDAIEDKCTLYRNRAACYLKLEKYEQATADADNVLKHKPNDVKALFRRSVKSKFLTYFFETSRIFYFIVLVAIFSIV